MLINTKNVKFIIQLFRLSRHPSSLGLKWCSPGVKWGDGIMPLFFLEKIAILNTCCNLKAITIIPLISVVFPFILLYKNGIPNILLLNIVYERALLLLLLLLLLMYKSLKW